jgi:hypothetical protein
MKERTMRSSTTIGRRAALRGAGGVLVGLPFLESLAPRAARAAGAPKRLVTIFMPDGAPAGDWFPSGGETGFSLSTILRAYEAVRSKMIFLKGINLSAGNNTHGGNLMYVLTGGARDSIDQVAADRLKAGVPLPSLELGVACQQGSEAKTRISYRGGARVPVEVNPNEVYRKIFQGTLSPGAGADPQLAARLLAQERSVVDLVLGELAAARARACAADRHVLDAHAQSIRDIEGALGELAKAPGSSDFKLHINSRQTRCVQPPISEILSTSPAEATPLAAGKTRIERGAWTARAEHGWGAQDRHREASRVTR